MKWKKFTIETTTEAEDLVAAMLGEIGVESIEIEDHVPLTEEETRGMFVDILPDMGPDDGKAKVSFYLSADQETKEATFQCGDAPRKNEEPDLTEEELLAQVQAGLEELRSFMDIGAGTILLDETESSQWLDTWRENFRPFALENFLIKPTWEEIPEEHKDKICITIEPGAAFGTGKHETTQLCIRQLTKYLKPGMEVLDVGTGSGILGIAAMKMGAAHAVGTELDPGAFPGLRENCELNSLGDENFHLILGNILDDKAVQDEVGYQCYDVVLANILAPVIVMLSGEIAQHMKPGSVIITSGIVQEKEQDVVDAFNANPEFRILEVTRQGEWVSVTAQKIA